MKIQKYSILFCVAFLMTFVAGCSSSDAPVEPAAVKADRKISPGHQALIDQRKKENGP